jgi:hypothetical protein
MAVARARPHSCALCRMACTAASSQARAPSRCAIGPLPKPSKVLRAGTMRLAALTACLLPQLCVPLSSLPRAAIVGMRTHCTLCLYWGVKGALLCTSGATALHGQLYGHVEPASAGACRMWRVCFKAGCALSLRSLLSVAKPALVRCRASLRRFAAYMPCRRAPSPLCQVLVHTSTWRMGQRSLAAAIVCVLASAHLLPRLPPAASTICWPACGWVWPAIAVCTCPSAAASTLGWRASAVRPGTGACVCC